MSESVAAMVAELGPLDPERAVLAAMARQLAGTLDGMSRPMRARMSGQTAGQLLKVLDKLGVPRRSPAPAAVDAVPVASSSSTDDWFEDFEYQERLMWIVMRHAERKGLPRPGSPSYSRNPWAGDPNDWDANGAQRHPWP